MDGMLLRSAVVFVGKITPFKATVLPKRGKDNVSREVSYTKQMRYFVNMCAVRLVCDDKTSY